MLYTLAAVMIVLWLLGMASSYTMGGLIHFFVVLAIIMVLLNIIQSRQAVYAAYDRKKGNGGLR